MPAPAGGCSLATPQSLERQIQLLHTDLRSGGTVKVESITRSQSALCWMGALWQGSSTAQQTAIRPQLRSGGLSIRSVYLWTDGRSSRRSSRCGMRLSVAASALVLLALVPARATEEGPAFLLLDRRGGAKRGGVWGGERGARAGRTAA